MTVNPSGWRPSAPANEQGEAQTVTGNRALMLEEPLIFEIGTARDRPASISAATRRSGRGAGSAASSARARSACRASANPKRCATTPACRGRITRSTSACSRSASCTMKHNPRLNEKVARLPGFADVHPLQPQETVQGALQVINELAYWLLDLTGMYGVAMSPKAGAHGELCGLLCIRAALEARGDTRAGRAGPGERARHQSGDRGLRRLSRREHPGERRRAGRPRRAEGSARPRRRGGDDHQPQHLRPVRAGHEGDFRRGACGGRVRLLRRRQFQRDRRQGPPRRPRHRRDAHQSAQDLLDPARRRRAGLGPGGPVGSACALRAAPLRREIRTARSRSSRRRHAGERAPRRPSAGWSPSTARWACSPARSPTSSATAPTA